MDEDTSLCDDRLQRSMQLLLEEQGMAEYFTFCNLEVSI